MKKNIAFIYFKEYRIAQTVYDHIYCFQKHSRHHITYFHALSNQLSKKTLEKFEVVVIHYTIAMFHDYRFPPQLRILLRNLTAKKVVFIQDEYRQINAIIENLEYIKADLLFTCFPDAEIEKVYPVKKLPNLIKVNTLTGFVPEKLLKLKKVPYDQRVLDVVYRSRRVPTWLGELGREKWRIAERFASDGAKFSLRQDISVEEFDRIYGKKWIKFLSKSKSALGVESGASVLDFDGEIQRKVENYEEANPWASFETIKNLFFSHLEGKVFLNQISPRCFECAALKTLMILYEGHYSGILIPWRHYIPLKKDHSNIEEIVSVLRDQKKWEQITETAYTEIACNPLYSYKNFVKTFDDHTDQLFSNAPSSVSQKRFIVPLPVWSFSADNVVYKVSVLGLRFLIMLPLSRKQKIALRNLLKTYNLGGLIKKIQLINSLFIRLKIKNIKKLLDRNFINIFSNKKIYEEAFILSTILSYNKKIKKIGRRPLLSFTISNNEAILYVGEQQRKKTIVVVETERHLPDFEGPLKVISEKSWGLPAHLRNLNVSLPHAQQIIELMK